ncbi:hypothetical protein OF83DRAFT_1115934 [Amylostereum chailletii]|nr:hypothetical protein OF83DRAFT_1115934 [Amylostereum chailletii]
MSKDFPLHHTAHEGSNPDRTELTTKAVPKAPKGKKKAPRKVKSTASKAATASTSKLPPTPKTVFRASEPADCPVCDRHFNRRADCERHIQTGNAAHVAYSKTETFKRTCTRKKARPARARCSLCDHTFSRKDALRRHVRETHEVDPDTVDCTQTVDMDVDEEEGDEQEYEDEDMDMDFY